MSAQIGLFVLAVAAMTGGSFGLSWSLDRVGRRHGVPAALMGLLTALGADAPEITTAVSALSRGHHGIGLGVVLGSNLFNLAALLGLGAVIANGLPIQRGSLIGNGLASLAATGAAALAIYRLLSPFEALAVLVGISLLYVFFVWRQGGRVGAQRRSELQVGGRATGEDRASGFATWAAVGGSLAAIVGGAILTSRTAVELSNAIPLPRPILGALVLAVLSSLPNAFTSAQLARRRQGVAVVGETIGSNTINIVVGIGVPACIFGLGQVRGAPRLEVWWLLGMTAAAALLPVPRARLGRAGGVLLMALYLAFVAARIGLAL